jgi:hypothetical protein
MVTRRARKRRAGGGHSDLLIRNGEIIHLKCKDCFFGVPVDIETGSSHTDGEKTIVHTVPMIECRFDSPQPLSEKKWPYEPARKFPIMGLEHDWCGCFRPKNKKCKGRVHCTVDPRECGPDCENHVEHETEE